MYSKIKPLSYIKLRNFAVSPRFWVSLVPAYCAVVLLLGNRTYQTNDDAALEAIVSGDMSGTPSSEVLFIQPLYGLFISSLYKLSNNFPWYGAAYSLLVITSITTIIFLSVKATTRGKDDNYSDPIIVAIFLYLTPYFLLELSFTMTTGLVTIAFLRLLHFLSGKQKTRPFEYILLSTFLIFALSMRVRFSLLILVFGCFYLLLSGRPLKQKKILLVAGIIAFITIIINRAILPAFQSEEFSLFLEFNEIRRQLHATARITGETLSGDLLDKIGWTDNDRALFSYSVYDDPSRFSIEKLQTVLSLTDNLASKRSNGFSWINFIRRHDFIILAIALSAFWQILQIQPCRRRAYFVPLILGASVLAGALIMGTYLRIPDRIAVPFLLLPTALNLVVLNRRHTRLVPHTPTSRVLALTWVVVLLSLAANSPFSWSKVQERTLARTRNYDAKVLFIEETNSEVVVSLSGAVTTQGKDPLRRESVFDNHGLLTLGWQTFSPDFQRRKERINVDSALEEVLKRENVSIIASRQVIVYYRRYLSSILSEDVVLIEVSCDGSNVCEWKRPKSLPN